MSFNEVRENRLAMEAVLWCPWTLIATFTRSVDCEYDCHWFRWRFQWRSHNKNTWKL